MAGEHTAPPPLLVPKKLPPLKCGEIRNSALARIEMWIMFATYGGGRECSKGRSSKVAARTPKPTPKPKSR